MFLTESVTLEWHGAASKILESDHLSRQSLLLNGGFHLSQSKRPLIYNQSSKSNIGNATMP